MDLPRYKCHKEVNAAKIEHIQPYGTDGSLSLQLLIGEKDGVKSHTGIDMTADWVAKHKPEAGGYLVVYEDGYTSYSPAKAFEGGYTLLPA